MTSEWLAHPLAQTLAWALVHFLWQGALIGLATFALMRVPSFKAQARYAIGIAGLALMLAAPIATAAVLSSRQPPARAHGSGISSVPGSLPATMAGVESIPSITESATRDGVVAAHSRSARTQTPIGLGVVLMFWCAGVALFSVRLAGNWLAVRRLVHRAVRPVGPEIHALVRRVSGRLALDRIVRVCESSAVAVPVMVGWLKPVVLLPASTISGLTPVQIEALIAHELAHVCRHDYLINLLQAVVETLLFYHPAVWWVSGQVRAEREHCCDDLAVGVCDRLVYVTALADLAALTAAPRVAMAASGGPLLSRVRRILGGADDRLPASGSVSILFVVLLAGVVAPVAIVSARQNAGQTTAVPRANAPAGGVSGGVSGGAFGGVRGGISGGVVGGVSGGVAEGIAGGVDGGVLAGLGSRASGTVRGRLAQMPGFGGDPQQGRPLTADERRRIDEEIARVEREQERDAAIARAQAGDTHPVAAAAPSPASRAAAAATPLSAPLPSVNAQAAAAVQAQAQAQAGAQAQSSSTSVSEHTSSNGSGEFVSSRNGEKLAIKWTGPFRLTDDDRDIEWIQPGQRVDISDGGWVFTSGVLLTGNADGTVSRTYRRNGFERPYEPEGREFLANALLKVVRQTGFAADSRVARFLKQGGVDAVLAEISKLEGDYVRRVYYTELFKQAKLSPGEIIRVADDAGRTVQSDYELGTLLKAAGAQATNDESRIALITATRTIGSDYDHRQTLTALLPTSPSPKVASAALSMVPAVQSDYERSTFLIEFVKRGGLSDATKDAFFDLVRGIKSSYEQGRVLKTVLAAPGVPGDIVADARKTSLAMGSDYDRRQVLMTSMNGQTVPAKDAAGVIEAASTIRSDNERAEVLLALAKKGGVTTETAPGFFESVGALTSSYEQRRVIAAVVSSSPKLDDGVMVPLLKATATVKSSNDCAEILIAVAKHQTLSPAARPLYIAAADGIRSDYDQTRALAELVRSEKSIR